MSITNLQRFYCSYCQISEIEPEAFSRLTNLVDLDLSENAMREVSKLLQNVPLTKRLTTSLHFPGSLWVMEAHASSNEAWHEWQSHQADSERSFRPFEVCHQPWAEPLRHWDCGKGCLWRDGQAKTTQVGFKQFAALVQRRSFPQNSSSCRGRKNFCLVLCAC